MWGHRSAKESWKVDIDALTERTGKLISRMAERYQNACEDCDHEKADARHVSLQFLYDIESALALRRAEPLENSIWTLEVSSMLLNDVRQILIDKSGRENECYCTGVADIALNRAVPTKLTTIKLAKQSTVFAEGAVKSVYQILSEFDRWGHPALLFCHCHPGNGAESTRPSGIDLRTHADLELCYRIVGVIFSQDGYVRFFGAGKPFQIEIFGTGVTKVDDNVYRIQD
jgi:hypothetical protein